MARKAVRQEEGNIVDSRNEELHIGNYWISERETENDRSGDGMEKVYTERYSGVEEETEQDYAELAGEELVPAHLWERRIEEAVEFNLKARPPSRLPEI